jgi:PAS domain S-box-containing protein
MKCENITRIRIIFLRLLLIFYFKFKALAMSFLKKISETGIAYAKSNEDRRSVKLVNYISLIAASAPLVLITGRILFYNINASLFFWFLCGFLIFLIPVVFNYFGYLIVGKIAVCWIPYIYIFALSKLAYDPSNLTSYIEVRYFFLAFSCFPFIVFNLKTPILFILGLLAPVMALLFFDPIMNAMGIGFPISDLNNASYHFNVVRTFISFLIIGGCSFFLKWVSEDSEQKNEKLLEQLAEKNLLIQQQAADEVHQLNQQLLANLDQLKEREFMLNQSQRIAKIGSWQYYKETGAQVWSETMYDIFGLDENFDLKRDNIAALLFGEEGKFLTASNNNVLTEGKSFDHIFKMKTPLGYTKWVRVYAYPIYQDDAIIGTQGICHDITLYKEAEEKVMANEKKYRLLFEQASDAIMVTDFTGNLTEANESLCKMTGYAREELLQMNVSNLIRTDHLKQRPISFDLLRIGEHIFTERPMVRKDGTIVEVEANVKKSDDDRVMAIVRDVTELRKVQRLVQLSEALFRGAFEDSAIGMAVVGLDGRWVKVNKELCNITGYSEDELLAKTFYEVTHPDDGGKDVENMMNVRSGKLRVFKVEKRYVHKDGSAIWVNINVSVIKDGEGTPLYLVSQIENISDKKNIEIEKDRARYQLKERIKELTTLYRTGQILQSEKKSIPEVLQEIVSILPPGWQYPSITAARIILGDAEFKTNNYASSPWRQWAEFKTSYGVGGFVEVLYLEDKPLEIEGPFLAEERDLINMIAEMIRVYLIRRHDVEALKESEANLNATINNTEIFIWSVDRNFNIITYNKPFADYLKSTYGVEIKAGRRIFNNSTNEQGMDLSKKWDQIYLRALAGEIISLEETRNNIDLKYSLSPIIEENKIIGVSVFADNITERKAHERELSVARMQIGELKLMALRSVMNPHFIFNVLNSIQFFIARNDRLNAINYLSTFSKLIRGILTHSVNNKIKLTEEIEMLKNYVQLEMTRFENKFQFVLNIEKEIEMDSIEIPSLLIQPYVENAILHGLYNKIGPGTLTINVLNREDAVVFEIQDDGIGREAAIKLQQQNFPVHKSMGIKLTEERLKLINEHHNVVFEVKDLMNESGPCGTKVIIGVTV